MRNGMLYTTLMMSLYSSQALSSQAFISNIHTFRDVKDPMEIDRNKRFGDKRTKGVISKRIVAPPLPPFPNGVCGGKIVSISPTEINVPEKTFLPSTNIFLPPRPIEVWLPPTYLDSDETHHPVLYVHDGQNAIEDSSSWTGSSWRLAGALTRLHERHLLRTPSSPVINNTTVRTDPLPILVLLPSSEGDLIPGMRRRHLEYADLSNPIAKSHAEFVAERLKPFIDSKFRTLSQKRTYLCYGN